SRASRAKAWVDRPAAERFNSASTRSQRLARSAASPVAGRPSPPVGGEPAPASWAAGGMGRLPLGARSSRVGAASAAVGGDGRRSSSGRAVGAGEGGGGGGPGRA